MPTKIWALAEPCCCPMRRTASGTVRQLAVGAGKDANIYVVDTGNMGKFNSSGNTIYQELGGALSGQEFGMPAFWNNTVYYGGVGDSIRAYPDHAGEAGHQSQFEDRASISVSGRDAEHFLQRHFEWNSLGRRQQQYRSFVCL